jgi:hypothetical protein
MKKIYFLILIFSLRICFTALGVDQDRAEDPGNIRRNEEYFTTQTSDPIDEDCSSLHHKQHQDKSKKTKIKKDDKIDNPDPKNPESQLNDLGCSASFPLPSFPLPSFSLPAFDSLSKDKIKKQEDEIKKQEDEIFLLTENNFLLTKEIEFIKRENAHQIEILTEEFRKKMSFEKKCLEQGRKIFETEIDQQRKKYEELLKENKHLCFSLSQKIESYKELSGIYDQDRKSWEEDRFSLKNELLMSTDQITGLKHTILKIKEDLDFSNSQVEQKKEYIKNLEFILESREIEIDNLKCKCSQLQSDLDLSREYSSRLERTLVDKEEMIVRGQKGLSSYLKKEEKDRESQIQGYLGKLLVIEEENELLRTQKEELEAKIKKNLSSGTIDELREKKCELEKLSIEHQKRITSLELQISKLPISPISLSGDSKKLNTKLRSFVPEFFIELFRKAGVEEKKIEYYAMELMSEELSLLELLQKAEAFSKAENVM